MTREERLTEAADLLAEAFRILGPEWPLLAVQVSHVHSAVASNLRILKERAA